ncbi:MAG: hypothetical protein ACREJ3_20245 [Polyangiaceae bacterium]
MVRLRYRALAYIALCAVLGAACIGCGGEVKQAESPASEESPRVDHAASAGSAGSAGDESSSAAAPVSDSAPPQVAASPDKPAYDKDAVAMELKRAARQVRANCGSATDDDGSATGPWGKTIASVTLGRNGHVQKVTVPAPYDGHPVGKCIVDAFDKIWFPPYAGSSDVVVDWDVEVVKPKP